jgi:transcriptional regulator with XRE-family HTH domain
MTLNPCAEENLADAPLKALGARIRQQRKALQVSAIATAEAAGISRVTLHRIEKGETRVAMGAYGRVLAVLGLGLRVEPLAAGGVAEDQKRDHWIPARIALADYPQLQQLAWHIHGIDSLSPAQAFALYERNARHLDPERLSTDERALLHALRLAFTPENPDV